MSIGLLFWILYIVALIFTGWSNRATPALLGGSLVYFVLIGLLGWSEFGFAIHR